MLSPKSSGAWTGAQLVGAGRALVCAALLCAGSVHAVSTVSINRTNQDGDLHEFTLSFSREVSGLEVNDLVSNGNIERVVGGGGEYRAYIRHVNAVETLFLSIFADAVVDSSGDGNFAATQVYPPTMMLRINPNTGVISDLVPKAGDGLPLENELQAAVFPIRYAYPVAGQPYPMRVSFDRAVGGFGAANIKVNGDIVRFNGIGSEYYFEATPGPDATSLRVALEFSESGETVQLQAITIPIIMRSQRLDEIDNIASSSLASASPIPGDELERSEGNPVPLPLPPVDPEAIQEESSFFDNQDLALSNLGLDPITDSLATGDEFIDGEVINLARTMTERELRLIALRDQQEKLRQAQQREIEEGFLYNLRLLGGAGLASGGDQLVASSGDVTVDFAANNGTQLLFGAQYYLPEYDNWSVRAMFETLDSSIQGDYGATFQRRDFAGGMMFDYPPLKLQAGADLVYSTATANYSDGITSDNSFLYASNLQSVLGFRFHIGYLLLPQIKAELRLISALEYEAIATRGGGSGDTQSGSISASGVAVMFTGILDI